jgi:hypothetical protein
MHVTRVAIGGLALLALAACADSVRNAEFAAPPAPTLTADVGATVMDVRVTRPSMLTVDAGGIGGAREIERVVVQFAGRQDGRAVLTRHYAVATMDGHAPIWAPVGVASPVPDYAAAAQPQSVALAPGEFLPLEGRRLIVRRVDSNSLDYTVE